MPTSANQMLRQVGTEKRIMTLWARMETNETQHFCMFCRKGLFRSKYRVIAVIYGDGVKEPFLNPPVSIQCEGCGTIWNLQGLNE